MKKGEVTKENILHRALNIFLSKGISSTSIRDIVNEAGIQKGSLYYFFPSKEDLAIEALKKAKENFASFLSNSMKGKNAAEKLSNYFKCVVEFHRNKKLKGGCIFGNSALEMCDRNVRIRKFLKGVFSLWHNKLVDLIEEGKNTGYFKEAVDPFKMAWKIIFLTEGAIMLSRTFRRIDFLEQCFSDLKNEILK